LEFAQSVAFCGCAAKPPWRFALRRKAAVALVH
jgi:hypothetical protein